MTPVYESILRYIINRGVCKTSNDLSGVFSFFFHITKVPVCQNKTTMERSLINIRDSFLFHQFLNQKKIIIINDQRTIFFFILSIHQSNEIPLRVFMSACPITSLMASL